MKIYERSKVSSMIWLYKADQNQGQTENWALGSSTYKLDQGFILVTGIGAS